MLDFRQIALLCVVGITTTSHSRAGDLLAQKIFPKSTTVFVQVENAKELQQDLKRSSVGQMLQDPSLRDLIADLWSVAEDSLVEFEKSFNVTLNELFEIADGEFAFGLVKRPRDNPGVLLLIDVGERPVAMRAMLERVEELMLAQGTEFSTREIGSTSLSMFEFSGDEEKTSVIFGERDSHLFATTHAELAEKVIAAWDGDEQAKPLGTDKIFNKTMKLAGRSKRVEPRIRVFVDPIATAYAVTGGNPAAQAGLAVVPLLGLKDVEGLAATISINQEKFDWVLHAHLLIEGDRHGIPEIIALSGHQPNIPDWIPADISTCSQFKLDVKSSLRALEKLVDLFQGENTTGDFIKNQISERIEIDFQKTILPEITGRFIRVERNRPDAIDVNPTSAIAIEFKDAGKLEEMLGQVATKYSLEEQKVGNGRYYLIPVAGNRAVADVEIELGDAPESTESGRRGRSRRNRLRRRTTPAVGVIDGFLVGSDDRGLMMHILENGTRDPFSKASMYDTVRTAIRSDLGVELPAYVSWSNNREIWRHRFRLLASQPVRARIREGANSNPWAMAVIKAMDEHPLPTFETVARYVAPGGAVLTNEETGFHYTAFSLRPPE